MLKLSLIKIQNERIKDKQKQVYKRIFENLCQTINTNAELGQNFCLFSIPEFIIDEISYPFDECLKYIDKKIIQIKNDKHILDVSFYKPNVYYIKWEL